MARRWVAAGALLTVLSAGCSPSADGPDGPGVEADLVQLESTLDAIEAELAGD